MKSLQQTLAEWPLERIESRLRDASEQQVLRVLQKEVLTPEDFLTLLSNAARPELEAMAQKADLLTRRHFGNSILLFTPLYISDYCENHCVYCAFAVQHQSPRHHMTVQEIDREAALIAESGIRHILLLTGEAPKRASLEYLKEAVVILKKHFSAPAIEIYPLTKEGYETLCAAGTEALTLYQETYDRKRYAEVHPKGPKSDFDFRLEAPERALAAGFRTVTLGPLLGLTHPAHDALHTLLHLDYLEKLFPAVEFGLSLPRIRPIETGFQTPFPVDDRLFVQIFIAFRLYKPRVGLTVSTRENHTMRNALLHLGATKMSAGVSTAVGGHTNTEKSGQFEIADTRTVDTMKHELLELGFQPVMVDWHHKLS